MDNKETLWKERFFFSVPGDFVKLIRSEQEIEILKIESKYIDCNGDLVITTKPYENQIWKSLNINTIELANYKDYNNYLISKLLNLCDMSFLKYSDKNKLNNIIRTGLQ